MHRTGKQICIFDMSFARKSVVCIVSTIVYGSISKSISNSTSTSTMGGWMAKETNANKKYKHTTQWNLESFLLSSHSSSHFLFCYIHGMQSRCVICRRITLYARLILNMTIDWPEFLLRYKLFISKTHSHTLNTCGCNRNVWHFAQWKKSIESESVCSGIFSHYDHHPWACDACYKYLQNACNAMPALRWFFFLSICCKHGCRCKYVQMREDKLSEQPQKLQLCKWMMQEMVSKQLN